MKTVNIHEAKTNLSKLLSNVEENHVVITICRYGKPIAELSPPRTQNKKKHILEPDPILSKGKILGDIVSPLPKEIWGSMIS